MWSPRRTPTAMAPQAHEQAEIESQLEREIHSI